VNISKNICFYFPYKEDSGVPVLFARMANELANNNPENIFYIIDYVDGAIARNVLSINNIRLIVYEDDVMVSLPQNAVLVMQSFVPYHWPVELKPLSDTEIFFWNLHPKNFIPSLLPITSIRDFTYNNFASYKILSFLFSGTIKKIRDFVRLLIKHEALCFMDETNYNSTKKYLFLEDFKQEYLPVPVSNIEGAKIRTKRDLSDLRYCWVGRVCDFKAYILVYTANKLAEVAQNNEMYISYFIIGDGPLMDYVKENIKENEYFKVKYKGYMPHTKLDEFLLDKIDVVTAMGTSALESAKLCLPTVLLDFSYEKIIGDYKFRNLYNTNNYDLGHAIDKADMVAGNNSLEDIVLSIAKDYETEGELAYNYYVSNHTIKSVALNFVKLINKTNLRFDMIDKRLLQKPKVLRLYYKLTSLLH
jgi:type VI protein secretion system component Hcp